MAKPSFNAKIQDIDAYRQQILSQPLAQGISPQEVHKHFQGLVCWRSL